MAAPRVSIIVPHYNDLDRLDLCLKHIAAQTFTDYEVVVGDNNSPGGIAAVEARVAGRARVVLQPEKGAGPARNAAIEASRGEILALTDADCLPDPNWLAAGIACLRQGVIVGGAMAVSVESENAITPVEAFERVFAFNNEDYVKRQGFSVTANIFLHRATFDRVGEFRVGVSEDVEWCHRARDTGFPMIYCPTALVVHPARRTWPELVRKWERAQSEAYLLHLAAGKSKLAWLARTWLLPASAVAHLPKVARARNLGGTGGRIGAATTLFRIRMWRFFRNHGLMRD